MALVSDAHARIISDDMIGREITDGTIMKAHPSKEFAE
jgi:hypothetical protein